jgi:hypothetical protein
VVYSKKVEEKAMLERGTVKAGDELVYEFGNRNKQRKIVKVDRVTSEHEATSLLPFKTIYRAGVIILENGARFTSEGKPIGLSSYESELYPLTPELRADIFATKEGALAELLKVERRDT